MEIDHTYLIDGEPYRLAQISTSLGSLPEYTFVPATNMGVETDPHTNVVDAIIQYPITANARADIVDAIASVPAQYPVTADELIADVSSLNLGTPYTAASTAVSAPPTDVDGDDATFVWDPPRVNGTPGTQYPDWRAYPDRSGIDGTFVGRRLQIQPVDDLPEGEFDITSVSSGSDDGNVVLERPRPLHPQIPTGDTYRRVSPNLSLLRSSPTITSAISDSVAVDAAGGQWEREISEEFAKSIRDALSNISPSKTPAEPIDNDAWDELFMPAT